MSEEMRPSADRSIVRPFKGPREADGGSVAPRPAGDVSDMRARYRWLEDELRTTRSSMACALASLLDLRDLDFGVHSTRLAEWAIRVGKLVGVSTKELRDIEVAAMLHDIGKMALSDTVLQKDGKLTPEEWDEVKLHPERGWGVLHGILGFEQIALFVLYHHERVDGKGYPAGLSGEDIPMGARIVAVVDAFDAMTSSRVYRQALEIGEAISRLRDSAGTQFDAGVVELFSSVVESDFEEVASIGDGAA